METPQPKDDQSASRSDKEDEVQNGENAKRLSKLSNLNFGKIRKHIQKKIKSHYWTKQRFMKTLKALGIFSNKNIKVFTASKELIKKLLQSKNHVIDTYNETKYCPQDEVSAEDMGRKGEQQQMENDAEEQAQNNEEMQGKRDQDGDLERAIKELTKHDDNEELPGNNQEENLDLEDSKNSKKVEGDIQKRRNKLVDLCHETFSTVYVLAYPAGNLAYEIPTVHCPNKYCHSNALRANIGKCAKREKTVVLYVIDRRMQFIPKAVTIGCACECEHFSYFA